MDELGLNAQKTDDSRPYRRPISFLEAVLASVKLNEYKDLIMLSDWNWVDQEDRERLKRQKPEFFNGDTVNSKKTLHEINRMTVYVHHKLKRINAPLIWTHSKVEDAWDEETQSYLKKYTKNTVKLVIDKPTIHRKFFSSRTGHDVFISTLEQAQAHYELLWKRYFLRVINPAWYVAVILRFPLSVMEYMGVDTGNRRVNTFVYWFVQALILLLILFIAYKIGIKPDIKLF
jgi:hypothetical protein